MRRQRAALEARLAGRPHRRAPRGLRRIGRERNLRGPMTDGLIYHMCRRDEWQAAAESGSYAGSSQDRADGFIHFSTGAQIVDSAAKHRAGQDGLVLLAVDPVALGPALKWEPSRSNQLFPHLYGNLPASAVIWVKPLPLGADGAHVFPELD